MYSLTKTIKRLEYIADSTTDKETKIDLLSEIQSLNHIVENMKKLLG